MFSTIFYILLKKPIFFDETSRTASAFSRSIYQEGKHETKTHFFSWLCNKQWQKNLAKMET